MNAQSTEPLDYVDLAKQLRLAADAMEDAQRARQHLDAILSEWEGVTDADKRDVVEVAIDRLNRVHLSQRFPG